MRVRKISIIVPCFNEEDVLEEFYGRVTGVAEGIGDREFEFMFVNDGSADRTAAILNGLADRDPRVKVLHFASNRGQQAALTAGMDYATGDMALIIDADLQDPPELLPQMLQKVEDGFDVVHAQRRSRKGETWFKLLSAWLFYKLINRLSGNNVIENTGDFKAFTRPVMQAVRRFREPHRFLRGIFSTIGFRQCVIQYDRDERFAGQTKYSMRKMLGLAANAVFSFSSSPIRFVMWVGALLWGISLAYLLKALVAHYVFNTVVAGWTTLIIVMTFFAGLQVLCLGIIGSYVGRIFEQGQRRPLYWLADARNVDVSQGPGPG